MLLTAKNPADLVAAVCVALGFIPTESVIVHMDWADDTNPGPPMFRVDLAAIGHVPAQVQTLARTYGPLSVSVVVIGADLGTGRTATADQVRTLEATLYYLIPVQIVAATDGHMAWCACDTPGCSDVRWSVDLQSHHFTAQAATEGHQMLTTAQVIASLTAGSTTAWAPVDAQAISDSIDFTTGDDPRAWVDRAVKMAAREIPAQTRTDVAHLVAASQVIPIRDLMWAHITRATAADALALWSWVARNTEPAKATNALALAAFAAWQTGDGHAARIACEHAAAIDPDHSMTRLVGAALGMDPRTWTQPDLADLQEHVEALWKG